MEVLDHRQREMLRRVGETNAWTRPTATVAVRTFTVERGLRVAFSEDSIEGWVSVGIDHDTASFAVNAIRRWWQRMGRSAYPQALSLVITADAGGSNGTRLRLWKWELQRFANRTGLAITVCHFPPGTSKWNRIEHRLFSHIAMNWRGTPLVNLATVVSLIGSTHSRSGLRVRSEIDRGRYPGGVTLTDAQMATIRLQRHQFHGDWNYTIHPTSKRRVSSLAETAPSSDDG